ncbi:MAG: ThuA domain-containing protein [Bryobacterales bacterium]|nr:ThuA domain-containing protein [Bryobacterales bacterium]
MTKLCGLAVLAAACLCGQPPPKRLLYVTHSAGFVHGSLGVSREAMAAAGARAGVDIVATDDLAYFDAGRLDSFDAVFFYTSGELALDTTRRQNLLDFVRVRGKGFGGAHSATDTLYQWPEYGEMIGGYFDGHPWVHEATVEVEDPDHPATRDLGTGPSFRMLEEFYQFRAFSRDRVRVLLTLDPRSIDRRAPGVNRTDEDFALAWVRPYGAGRVFYTALGHFDETWRDPRFTRMLEGALRYLTGQTPDAGSAPRRSEPAIARIASAAAAADTATPLAPGLLFTISGTGLTTGSTLAAAALPLPTRLAGTAVKIDGAAAGLVSASPERIVAVAPAGTRLAASVPVEILTGVSQTTAHTATAVQSTEPGILAGYVTQGIAVLYATGLALPDVVALDETGRAWPIEFAGPAPALAGIQQVNARIPDAGTPPRVRLRSAGRDSAPVTLQTAP